ncbi:hypothetical protein TKK_0003168 [Trichogramma kaykai]
MPKPIHILMLLNDYASKHQNSNVLLDTWEEISTRLQRVMLSELNNDADLELFAHISEPECTENTKNIIILSLIGSICHRSKSITFKKKQSWRPSISESVKGFMLHVPVNRSLGFFPLDKRHKAEYSKSKLQYVFEQFKLDKKKLNVLITDGEQAIKNAAIEVVGIDKYLTFSAHKVSHLIPDVLKTLSDSDTELKKARLNLK